MPAKAGADQSLSGALFDPTRCLQALLEEVRPQVLITHAYEGGHPDHDAAAFARQLASHALSPRRGRPGSNCRAGGAIHWGRFISRPNLPVAQIVLTKGERARKEAMLACFKAQAEVLRPVPGPANA